MANQSSMISSLFPIPKSIKYIALISETNPRLSRWIGHRSHLSNAPFVLRIEEKLKPKSFWKQSVVRSFADIANDNWMLSINFDGTLGGHLKKIIFQFFFKLYFLTLAKAACILALLLTSLLSVLFRKNLPNSS